MSVKQPQPINQLAVWLPMKSDDINIKVFSAGYPYLESGVVNVSDENRKIIRYAKNYEVGIKRYSLCLITTENSVSKIEDFMDEESKKVKLKDITNKFKMLDIYYE